QRLEENHVELDAELPQILVLLGALRLDPDRTTATHPLVLREVREAPSLARENHRRELDEVVAVVAPLGNLRRPPDRLLHPCPQGAGELVDLSPRIVHVKLARHRVSRPLEQRRDAVAQRRPAPVPHVQRPGRIRRDEFHVHARSPPPPPPPSWRPRRAKPPSNTR